MDYSEYRHLAFEHRDNGVLLIELDRPDELNAMNARMHRELGQVWRTVGADDDTRVAVLTGRGKAFCAGADLELVEENATHPARLATTLKESSDLVYNLINLDKPVISAINGIAIGAGLVVALLADISIISERARLTDGHLRVGVAAGDHATLVWPLLCGMAKAKYYLLTSASISGTEAERIGLVSLCVPEERLMTKAFAVADRLALGPQNAIRLTKRSMNNWLRQAGPLFDNAMALELLTFMEADVREGIRALREQRPPRFPSVTP